MTTNQEHIDVTVREKRDQEDGFERGYYSPYPKEREEVILANIEKVSPSFVKGYRSGKAVSLADDAASSYEPPDFNEDLSFLDHDD